MLLHLYIARANRRRLYLIIIIFSWGRESPNFVIIVERALIAATLFILFRSRGVVIREPPLSNARR